MSISPSCHDNEIVDSPFVTSFLKKRNKAKKEKNAIRALQEAIRTNLTQLEKRRESPKFLYKALMNSERPIKAGNGEYIWSLSKLCS